MLISDAKSIFYGITQINRVYLDGEIVWGRKYIISKNNLTTGGFPVGTVVNKSASVSNRTSSAIYLPGNTDFTAARQYWPDWGDDIFDSWGFFYLYDPVAANYTAVNFNNIESADGVINTQTLTFNGRLFTFKYGYPVQGIFKIDISVNDSSRDFFFGFDGNLGSNGTTINNLLAYNYSIGGESFTLHYNYNYQGANPTEKFYTYVIPYEREKNKTVRPYTRYIYGTDNLSLHTNAMKRGVTIYIAKQADTKDWVVNDLQVNFA